MGELLEEYLGKNEIKNKNQLSDFKKRFKDYTISAKREVDTGFYIKYVSTDHSKLYHKTK